MGIPDSDHEIDARGLTCPEPLMIVRHKVREMSEGEIVYVRATDPSTERDLVSFCRFLGHALLESTRSDGLLEFWIRKGG
ncbi:MAG: sulfurtransferase TusA [Pseudomonadales bacterium]|jgi:tRNA 2-thiouridine synthesizing protein A|nr:sulfurtransferase TusA [Pseudomonadales bacterium]MDP6472881.1 sulfurtransferase TusA [Pseudomonadales bacterium]MDP6826363.1 sulfurtransferase TusA [Pseudomonadales bacterium]MDP6973293.1 sulfurtransferase TusA [Pseudomonadales bacterium]|tara:strand:- start:545 stop:784 length:240 start_codon:yes stop_codon:yes gene_type:complete